MKNLTSPDLFQSVEIVRGGAFGPGIARGIMPPGDKDSGFVENQPTRRPPSGRNRASYARESERSNAFLKWTTPHRAKGPPVSTVLLGYQCGRKMTARTCGCRRFFWPGLIRVAGSRQLRIKIRSFVFCASFLT